MWIFFAILSALFSGITSIFAKIGLSNIDTDIATGIRTIIILFFSLIFFLITGETINNVSIYIILSGITTALLLICYFKALYYADVNKVTPIDKTSIILTLLLSYMLFKEEITYTKIISIILILLGTYLMVDIKNNKTNSKWIIYAILTSIFTSLITIFGKYGMSNLSINASILIRSFIAFIIIWIYIFIKRKHKLLRTLEKRNTIYIILSSFTTWLSWLFYFNALNNGETSIVFTIEKLSIVVTITLSTLILKEKLAKKSIIGLIIILFSTILLII